VKKFNIEGDLQNRAKIKISHIYRLKPGIQGLNQFDQNSFNQYQLRKKLHLQKTISRPLRAGIV